MNFWSSMPYERLRQWYDFRKSLTDKTLDSAVNEVQHLWSYAPFVKYYLTTDMVDQWPNPWELLYDNVYCDLAKALGIVYTLYLSDHKPDLEIRVYKDDEVKEYYNLVFVDKGKYVLNYQHDEVVNKKYIKNDLVLVKKFNSKDLRLDQLK